MDACRGLLGCLSRQGNVCPTVCKASKNATRRRVMRCGASVCPPSACLRPMMHQKARRGAPPSGRSTRATCMHVYTYMYLSIGGGVLSGISELFVVTEGP